MKYTYIYIWRRANWWHNWDGCSRCWPLMLSSQIKTDLTWKFEFTLILNEPKIWHWEPFRWDAEFESYEINGRFYLIFVQLDSFIINMKFKDKWRLLFIVGSREFLAKRWSVSEPSNTLGSLSNICSNFWPQFHDVFELVFEHFLETKLLERSFKEVS